MLNQEDFYRFILNENWTEIVKVLHKHKNEIQSDTLLKQAAIVFEEEYFKKVAKIRNEDNDTIADLENLYVLNSGKFYEFQPENYKKLVLELVKRKGLHEAYDFATLFPEEPVCTEIIQKYRELKKKEDGLVVKEITSLDWIQIYNRLFDLMNEQSDTATYFSGSRFINTVREYEPFFPEYMQYIDNRNAEGKSTSRKIFYYDILLGLSNESREKVISRILEIVQPFKPEKVYLIEELLGKHPRTITIDFSDSIGTTSDSTPQSPIVFISYSWDDETHKIWVLNLANRLIEDGVDVILDRYFLKPGKNLPHFVEQSLTRANRIIIIYTPNYKLKADNREGGVGYEYSIMNADLYRNQTTNEKIIPVLRAGDKDSSIPAFMQQFIHLDISNNANFENSYRDLLREIYNEPSVIRPQLGKKPKFN